MLHQGYDFFQKPKDSFLPALMLLLPLAIPIAEMMFINPGYGQTINPSITQVAQVPTVQKLPVNGKVKNFWRSTPQTILAPLKIYTKGNRHHFIKVINPKLNQSVLTVFVQAGRDVSLQVPVGTYEIKYATGTQWYGENDLFGANTFFGQAERQLVFQVNGNKVQGYRLHLYPQVGGNLKTKTINRNEFLTKNKYLKTNKQVPKVSTQTYYNRALTRIEYQDYQGAIADFNQVLKLEPDNANAYIGRGLANFSLANYSAAKLDFDQALVITPDVAYAYYFRGFSRYLLHDTEGAISDLQKASTLFTQAGKPEIAEKAIAAVNKIQASHNNLRLQTFMI